MFPVTALSSPRYEKYLSELCLLFYLVYFSFYIMCVRLSVVHLSVILLYVCLSFCCMFVLLFLSLYSPLPCVL